MGSEKLFTHSVSAMMTRSYPNPKKAAARITSITNQFEDDDPYSKMYPLIDADATKY
jgi:hypothetical protein